jgi:TPP-dependent pyruvate/acetoin dehydrogenase alpha subunit
VEREIAAAVEFAEAAGWEPLEQLYRHVYTEVEAR